MPPFVESVIGQMLDPYQDTVCAEKEIPSTYNMKSKTCIAAPGFTARCTLHRGLANLNIRLKDRHKLFTSNKSLTAIVRGCSYYKTDEVPDDGCHKQDVLFEDNAMVKFFIERYNISWGKFEGEVCVSNSSVSAAATTSGIPQGQVSSLALFSLSVTTVYLFNQVT